MNKNSVRMEKVVIDYLKHIGAKANYPNIEDNIFNHPDYPSVLSISDVLSMHGCKVNVVKVDLKKAAAIQYPCLVHVYNDGGGVILVKSLPDFITKINNFERASGVLIKIESKISSNTFEYRKYIVEKGIRYALILSLCFLLFYSIFNLRSINLAPSLILPIIGTVIGFALVFKDLGIAAEELEKFCSTQHGDGCDKVTKSASGTIMNIIKLSDIVLAYFSFQITTVLMLGFNAFPTLKFISLFSLLAVPYSIYNQAKIGTWCNLCILTLAIIIAECAYFNYNYAGYGLNIWHFIYAVAALVSIMSATVIINNTIRELLTLKGELALSNRIKNSFFVFSSILKSTDKIDVTNDNESKFVIGNINSPIHITMIANLYCGPCEEKLLQLSQFVKKHLDDVCLELLFIKNNPDELEISANEYIFNYWLANIKGAYNELERTVSLLLDWYDIKNLDTFSTKYKENDLSTISQATNMYNKQLNVIKNIDYSQTPTLYVNGYNMPNKYSIFDLEKILPEILNEIKNFG
ncbi:vitamin K epoxide reductase family protein (plasmid) [Hymenobacter sp. BRD128]|uniref:vitamin K epoxide reductase family protein n=1 Tax=Hymenobacter sp. BRD128 TaxID=2675878 RepID=UPI001565809A|nr:vitamin K epoxide reductase family protein [Hymenobacter sp. BRD128]QKG59142.1 vitamin K epoxide reductase family protein [Hymenobacter sp. BRD128]